MTSKLLGQRPKYRYVITTCATRYYHLLGMPLYAANELAKRHIHMAFRITVPEQVKPTRDTFHRCVFWPNGMYCDWTLEQANAMPVIFINGRWKTMPELIDHRIDEWQKILNDKYLFRYFSDVGFLTPDRAVIHEAKN